MKKNIFIILSLIINLHSEEITNSTQINISKNWNQEPNGWTYPMNVNVPNIDDSDQLPVCILLHGFGNNGENLISEWQNFFQSHILIAPTGYLNCWNISNEPSEAPDVEMINELVELLQTYHNVDSNRIRILGISNGSALANRVFIENTNLGIDIICTIVSQLSEPQYHNNNFYYPSGETDNSQDYNGYDTVILPIQGRKYLNIGNINDPMIPYYGGYSVGVNFLNSLDAIFIIANSQGYEGYQLHYEGNQIGSSSVYEYSYLSNHVVHLKGNASHSINEIQREYIIDFFSKVKGDINGDNILDILDIITAINFILSNQYNSILDLNSDGIINILDLMQMVDNIIN